MKKIFIFGYYGFNNIGDEAILEAIVGQFKIMQPEMSLTALSYNAAETKRRYGIQAVSRNRFWDVFQSIRESHLVMSGGGSILQDVTSSRSLMYYLGIILLAKFCGKKVAFYGNGFGPVQRLFNRQLVKHIINQVDLITVRDQESKSVMEKMGIRRKILVTADAAFTLKSSENNETKIFSVQPGKRVGISVRKWKNQSNYLPVIAACADQLVLKGYKIFYLPMQPPGDSHVAQEAMALMQHEAQLVTVGDTPQEMIDLIAEMDFVIGMRLHALIFAAIAGVPMVGLSYESKITSFLKRVEQPCAGEVESLTYDQLMASVESLLEKKEYFQLKLMENQTDLRHKAMETTNMIREFLVEGDEV